MKHMRLIKIYYKAESIHNHLIRMKHKRLIKISYKSIIYSYLIRMKQFKVYSKKTNVNNNLVINVVCFL